MHYGVTFSAPGQEQALETLDKVLEYYSFFSLPTLVHGDKQREAAGHDGALQDARGAAVVPAAVVVGDGKRVMFILLESSPEFAGSRKTSYSSTI